MTLNELFEKYGMTEAHVKKFLKTKLRDLDKFFSDNGLSKEQQKEFIKLFSFEVEHEEEDL